MMWLLLLSLAYANEQVVTILEGEKAPFEGTLMNPEAVAKLIAGHEYDIESCLANAKKDLRLLETNKDFKIKLKESKLAQCSLELEKKQKLYNDRIDWLENKVSPPSWKGPSMFVGGVLTGVGLVTLSAWTLDKIQEN